MAEPVLCSLSFWVAAGPTPLTRGAGWDFHDPSVAWCSARRGSSVSREEFACLDSPQWEENLLLCEGSNLVRTRLSALGQRPDQTGLL